MVHGSGPKSMFKICTTILKDNVMDNGVDLILNK